MNCFKKALIRCSLKKVVQNSFIKAKSKVFLFAILKNETLRLPYFLKYYRNIGVDHFFFIDNDSCDGSLEFLKMQSNVTVFSTKLSYKNHWLWMEVLLERYAYDHWCLVVDIDELFYIIGLEKIGLPGLITYLENKQFSHVPCLFLDLYSKKKINEVNYQPGESPLKFLRFFDNTYERTHFTFWDRKNKESFMDYPYLNGGVKDRIFGRERPPELSSKIPLFKYSKRTYLTQGMHSINRSVSSDIEGVVYHTKFLQDFESRAKIEANRGVHFDGASRYRNYVSILEMKGESISFFKKEYSIEIGDDQKMIDLGVLKSSSDFDKFLFLFNS